MLWVFPVGPLVRDQIAELPIFARHTTEVADLPDHHSDPFDRLLVAQARVEDLLLVTADKTLVHYEVELFLN